MKTNKWKLALLVWSAMFPFSTAISYGMSMLPFTTQWPIVARTFCLMAMLVPFMVFGALPFLNRRFRHWLQMPKAGDRSIDQNAPTALSTYPRLTTNGVET